MEPKTYIVKTEKGYFEWDCTTRQPIGEPVPLAEFEKSYLKKYGINRAAELRQRLARVTDHGTSSLDWKITPEKLGVA